MGPIKVMLVDDHAVVRMGFKLLLAACEDIEVVGEADSGETAYVRYAELKPDVVVMDLSMPGMGGIEAVRRLTARDKGVRILALSAHEDTAHPKRVLKAGATGYLSKRGAPEALIDAVRTVASGRMYLDAEIAQKLAMQDVTGAQNPVEALSEREFEVFIHLARGQSVNQIAETLHLSTSTIGTHLYNVKQKLGASNQAELTLIALRNGLIEA
ncbi:MULTISPECIES: response regulator transcription factor [unclassified Methyloversatilis]|jgi:two-component system invasion response regulator UvrY|uniref:response regulator n=1 Tax=unclassified Methyloversatilis TaxID=2639971 RepID=UPI001A3B69E7|nr:MULTISPECIES: response regulator transcription factor [unclassified Methyloversatilis]MBL8476850.1 response regulator transcription factor [Methyloversatilis sp.]MCQ9374178.1 response regulator transcription factor [Methyloversatilis sp. XJ19-13]MCQ9376801.1 response regulator transcription factor [Methyloversatilis sp. XJ19-49]MDP2868009.1 response regulator transcription factor [Methyloversatilis sp.]MDP3454944.1 response regulator transcription factor [Methyloversatilis sp.]